MTRYWCKVLIINLGRKKKEKRKRRISVTPDIMQNPERFPGTTKSSAVKPKRPKMSFRGISGGAARTAWVTCDLDLESNDRQIRPCAKKWRRPHPRNDPSDDLTDFPLRSIYMRTTEADPETSPYRRKAESPRTSEHGGLGMTRTSGPITRESDNLKCRLDIQTHQFRFGRGTKSMETRK